MKTILLVATIASSNSMALHLQSLYELLNSEIFATMNFPSVPYCILNTIAARHTTHTTDN